MLTSKLVILSNVWCCKSGLVCISHWLPVSPSPYPVGKDPSVRALGHRKVRFSASQFRFRVLTVLSLVRLGLGSFGYVFDPIHLNWVTKTLNVYVLAPISWLFILFGNSLVDCSLVTVLTADSAECKCMFECMVSVSSPPLRPQWHQSWSPVTLTDCTRILLCISSITCGP